MNRKAHQPSTATARWGFDSPARISNLGAISVIIGLAVIWFASPYMPMGAHHMGFADFVASGFTLSTSAAAMLAVCFLPAQWAPAARGWTLTATVLAMLIHLVFGRTEFTLVPPIIAVAVLGYLTFHSQHKEACSK